MTSIDHWHVMAITDAVIGDSVSYDPIQSIDMFIETCKRFLPLREIRPETLIDTKQRMYNVVELDRDNQWCVTISTEALTLAWWPCPSCQKIALN